jgi:hypothetical protein
MPASAADRSHCGEQAGISSAISCASEGGAAARPARVRPVSNCIRTRGRGRPPTRGRGHPGVFGSRPQRGPFLDRLEQPREQPGRERLRGSEQRSRGRARRRDFHGSVPRCVRTGGVVPGCVTGGVDVERGQRVELGDRERELGRRYASGRDGPRRLARPHRSSRPGRTDRRLGSQRADRARRPDRPPRHPRHSGVPRRPGGHRTCRASGADRPHRGAGREG